MKRKRSKSLVKKKNSAHSGLAGVIYLGDIKPGGNYIRILSKIMEDPEEKRNTVADLIQLRDEIVDEFSDEFKIRKMDIKIDAKNLRLITTPDIAEQLSFVMENCAI